MELLTERCIIRNLCVDDAGDLYSVLSDADVMKYIEPSFDMDKTVNFIQEAGSCDPPLVYAVVWRHSGKVIGHIIFHPFDAGAYELGWVLSKDFWGKGIADELTRAMVEYARHLGIKSCVIECDARQIASKAVARKHGFAYEGNIDALDRYRLTL